jgi:hypothetical protein
MANESVGGEPLPVTLNNLLETIRKVGREEQQTA